MKTITRFNKEFLKIQNKIFLVGKKQKLENIINKLILNKNNNFSITKFLRAVELLKSDIDILPVKKRGKIYKIPTGVTHERGLKLGLKFLKEGIYNRKENSTAQKIFLEVNDIISLRKCYSLNLKNDMYQAALFNRAFIHFRWR